jgi:sn-glycerol 3-phosphate transport system ATP-binding protein
MTGIEIRDLVKQWGATRAVDGVSFVVPRGALCVLLGPSGCGKSTILRMIAGLEDASSGEVWIDGRDVTHVDASRRGVSMVFQSYALFPHLNVRENILFGLKVRRVPRDEQARRLSTAAGMVGLSDLLDRKPAQLSGGQRQRVALARSIVADQPVCLMDEPLSNLDAKLRAEMRDEICSLQRKLGLTMIYVTHDQTEAMSMADQVVLLNAGRVEQTAAPADLYESPATVFAARFLGLPPMNILPVAQLRKHQCSGLEPNGVEDDWLVGVRPEHLVLGDTGLPMTVSAIDYMGAESILRLSHDGNTTMARVAGRSRVKPGEKLHVSWLSHHVQVFDNTGSKRVVGAERQPLPA